jgi:hypothetical protein
MTPTRSASEEQTPPRALAYAPPPLTDEPLDGYLEHVAAHCIRPPSDVHRHLGLTNLRPYSIVRTLDAAQAQRLAFATGIPAPRLRAMTLERYAHLGLMPRFDKRGHGTGTWARGSGARYCPDCLTERDGRWRLSWYLQWTFACVRHQRLLHPRCPRCGRAVRSRPQGHPISPHPVAANYDQMTECNCPTDLLAAEAHRTALSSPRALLAPVVHAQEVIHGVINGPRGEPVVALGEHRSRLEWMHDLASLTRLLMTHLPADHIPPSYAHVLTAQHVATQLDALTEWPAAAETLRQVSPTADRPPALGQGVLDLLASWDEHLALRTTGSAGVRLGDATMSPPAIALTATAAATILTSPDVTTAHGLLNVLPTSARLAAVAEAAPRRLSWPLIQALDIPSTSSRARPARARLLRLQSARFRPDGTERPPLDPAKVPAHIWHTVAVEHSDQLRSGYAGFAASLAMLSLATKTGVRQSCQRLAHPHLGSLIEKQLTDVLGLAEAPPSLEGPTLFDDLLLLHDVLATSDVPIDYTRRRRTFPDPVPPAERTARRIARELEMRPTPRLRRFMGWWIFELLTGSDVLLSHKRLDLHASHRLAYARQRADWLVDPPPALLRRAEHALLRNCLDEPLTWAPVRSIDGIWRCPEPQVERQLDWSNRKGRASTRLGDTAVDGLELRDAVRFAVSAQTLGARRLAVKLARFALVVEARSITKAAGQAGLSQSSLSNSMAALERELTASLIDRHGHGVTLTPAGRHLLRLLRDTPIRNLDPAEDLRPSAHPRSLSKEGTRAPSGQQGDAHGTGQ